MIALIVELFVGFVLAIVAVAAFSLGHPVVGVIAMVIGVGTLVHGVWISATGRIKTPRGLASGVPIYDGRDDE